jgi:hypothetical protein
MNDNVFVLDGYRPPPKTHCQRCGNGPLVDPEIWDSGNLDRIPEGGIPRDVDAIGLCDGCGHISINARDDG